MPPRARKDPPKEPVIYPASKRKTPAFKSQRPGKVPRVEGSVAGARGKTAVVAVAASSLSSSGGGFRSASGLLAGKAGGGRKDGDVEVLGSSSDGDLDEDPLVGLRKKKKKETGKALGQGVVIGTTANTASEGAKVTSLRAPSRLSPDLEIFSSPPESLDVARETNPPPPLSQTEEIPTIPQPLLLRLLHEGFANKSTKIDKHAVQVLQKYMDVFVREAIARAALSKREAAERGEADEADKAWLELEDLEKIAPGMLLDF
nr:centromere protein x [Quercus suber]